MAEVCSCKGEPRERISTAVCDWHCWCLKVVRAKTGCGTFRIHGGDGEVICDGSNHLRAPTLPDDVQLELLVGP